MNNHNYKKPIPFSTEEFKYIVDQMKELHEKKNVDYSGVNYLSNYTASNRMGIPGWVSTALRLQDKMSRLENFIMFKKLEVKDENIEDTLMDMAVISILTLILYRNKK